MFEFLFCFLKFVKFGNIGNGWMFVMFCFVFLFGSCFWVIFGNIVIFVKFVNVVNILILGNFGCVGNVWEFVFFGENVFLLLSFGVEYWNIGILGEYWKLLISHLCIEPPSF